MLGVLSTVGITLVAATVIGFFIGLKLDELLGTSPWLQIIFLLSNGFGITLVVVIHDGGGLWTE